MPGFESNIDLLMDLVELEALRIRKAAKRRELSRIRESLTEIRSACREIGHDVTEKDVMQEWPNGG